MTNQPAEETQARPRRARQPGYEAWHTSPLLTAEEERALAARIKAGDVAARERLILANLRLVVKIAHRYAHTGTPLDDLIQEGSRALIRAVDCFDPQTHNTRFSTYATHWIRKGIQVAMEASGPLIHVPSYLLRLRYCFERVMDELRSKESAAGEASHGPSQSLTHAAEEALVQRLNVSDDRLGRLRQSMIRRSSLCQKDADGEEIPIEAMVASRYRPDRELELAEARSELHRAIDRLSALESLLIRYRFGMIAPPRKRRRKDGRSASAQSEAIGKVTSGRIRPYVCVSRALGISVPRVRAIEQRALAKLRAALDPGLLASLE